ncbi:hypothetical protein AB7M47_006595 [Bradyrhizobium elkanii]
MRRQLLSICGMIAVMSGLSAPFPFAAAQPAPSDQGPHPQSGGDRSLASAAEIWDDNHDGVYTCDEWKAYLGRLFDRADRNHDGRLTPAEFEAVRRAGSALADADFGYFDEKRDGKVTRGEFVDKPNEFILQFDKNGDCRVTPDELKQSGSDQKRPGGRGKRF